MALVDAMAERPWGMVLVAVLVVLLLGAVTLMLFGSDDAAEKPAPKVKPAPATIENNPALNGSFWACNGLVCARYMTPQEWVARFCFARDGQNLCSVNTPQGPMDIALSALNLSAIQDCAEYTCVQEVLVRNASYAIPVT